MTADQRSDSMLPHFRTYCPVQLQLTMIVGLLVLVLGCDPIAETQPDSRAKQSDVTDRSGVSSEGSSLPAIQPEEKVTALDRDASLAAVDSFLNKKKPDQAVSLLKAMLVKNPTDVEVIFRLAMVTGNQGNLEAAIDLLAAIPPDHPQAGGRGGRRDSVEPPPLPADMEAGAGARYGQHHRRQAVGAHAVHRHDARASL